MKQEVQPDNEDGRIKEQAVLDLGTLLAKHGRAAGDLCFCSVHVCSWSVLPEVRRN